MSKVMLVEDDNNLREIYEARLQAEGYDIVTAHDGEEALVVAKAEQPDLIISDVMMPKISGFEMLDILRNTDGLKDVKIIMLTALGQADDQQRADRLGADSYLVKSQVTLEDIVQVAGRLLGGDTSEATPATPEPAGDPEPAVAPAAPIASPVIEPVPTPPAAPEVAVPAPTVEATPAPEPVSAAPVAATEPATPAVTEPGVATDAPVAQQPASEPAPAVMPPIVSEPTTETVATVSQPPVVPETVDANHEPTTDAEFMESLGASAEATPVSSEAATVEAQIAAFATNPASPAPQVSLPETPVEPVGANEPAAAPESAVTTPPAEQFVTTPPPDLDSAVPAPEPTPESAGNDDVLATALESLTGQAPSPSPESVATTVVPPASETSGLKGGNRVITPLDMPSKPDINTLLAMEEAKEQAAAAPVAPVPPVVPAATLPTDVPAPVSEPVNPPPVAAAPPASPLATPPPAQPFDPNSIAL